MQIKPLYDSSWNKYKDNKDAFLKCFFIKLNEAMYMILEEYKLESSITKIYNDYIVENIDSQKEYIDNTIKNLIDKSSAIIDVIK